MHSIITLSVSHPEIQATVPLTSSKSESNRALILQALAAHAAGGQSPIRLANLSDARDTRTMQRLLASEGPTFDVLDAGTTMRFLTAYFAATGREAIMTGTERMRQRPIGLLVEALRTLGANIRYADREGFPPLHILPQELTGSRVSIRGDVSSQFISALLMVAPTLPNGLELVLTGQVASRPYIEMTLELMHRFGVKHTWEGDTIRVEAQRYQPGEYTIESDWSGASYWFSIGALAQSCRIRLLNLRENSLQGDSHIVRLMQPLGVQTTFRPEGVILERGPRQSRFQADFSDCPDLAQTVAVACAALGIPAELSGLESLRIKETDRIAAIVTELARFGVRAEVEGDRAIRLPGGPVKVEGQTVRTYEDHRMAMAFAPLALLGTVRIEEPGVVEKSYPDFWKHLQTAGFRITETAAAS